MSGIALQLCSVREHLADLDALFGRIADLGISHVEPFSIFDRTIEVLPALRRHGLTAPTGRASFLSGEIDYHGNRLPLPPLPVTLQAASAYGFEVLLDPR